MSDDVQNVLANYLAVIGKKDADIFSFYEHNESLKVALTQATEEAKALSLQLRETCDQLGECQTDNQSLCSKLESATEELLALRQFEAQVRRSLLMTSTSMYSRSSVARSIEKCIDDRDTLASLTPLFALYVQSSFSAVEDLELASRRRMCELQEAAWSEISFVLTTLFLQFHQLEQDEITMSAALLREERRCNGKRVAIDIVDEVGRLQRHVEELLQRNDVTSIKLDDACDKVRVYRSACDTVESALAHVTHCALSRETALVESFLCLREKAIYWCLRAKEITPLTSEKNMLQTVNQQLRDQLRKMGTERSAISHKHDLALRSIQQATAKQASDLQSEVIELREKLSLALQKDKELQGTMQCLRGELKGTQAALEAVHITNKSNESHIISLEKKIRKSCSESQQYKELLEALQQRCAQVRELLIGVEERLDRSQSENEGLRNRISVLQEGACSQTEECNSLRAQCEQSAAKYLQLTQNHENFVLTSNDKISSLVAEKVALAASLTEAKLTHERVIQSKDAEIASIAADSEKASKRRDDDTRREALLHEQYRVEIQLLNAVIEKERAQISALETKFHSGAGANPVGIIQGLELENASLKMRVDDLRAACDLSVRRSAELREQLCVARAKAPSANVLDTSVVSSNTTLASSPGNNAAT